MSLTTNLIKNFVLFLNSIFTCQTRLVCKTKKKNKDIVTVIAERNPGTSILPWHAIVDYFSTCSQEVFFSTTDVLLVLLCLLAIGVSVESPALIHQPL